MISPGGLVATLFKSAGAAVAAAVDSYFNYVSLLLNAEPASPLFTDDASPYNFTVTQVGSPLSNIKSPFVGSPGSAYFNGTTAQMSVVGTSELALGAGDFTAEMWFYPTQVSTFKTLLQFSGSGAGGGFNIQQNLNTIWVLAGSSAITTAGGGTTFVANTWHHVAVTRSGTAVKVYLNGVLSISGTNSTNFTSTSMTIGGRNADYYVGYISNLRLVKGTVVYTSNFTPSTTPLTSIPGTNLLTFQHPGDGTNNIFVDSSNNNFAITRTGTPTQGTFSPFSNAGWSGYFPNNGSTSDLFQVPTNTGFNFGGGDFTVEAWANSSRSHSGTGADYGYIYGQSNNIANNNNRSHGLAMNSNSITFYYSVDGGADQHMTWSYAFTLGVWYHIAVVRSGNTISAYVNGTLVSTQAFTATIFSSTAALSVGGFGRYPIDNGYYNLTFSGNISNLRLVKGAAVYTTNFTPSTAPLTAIAGTSLLTLQDNRFKDNSTNNFSLTATGTPSIQSVSPFAPTAAYSPAVNGGSILFGRVINENHLASFTNSTTFAQGAFFGTGKTFTIESWVYPTAWNAWGASYTNVVLSDNTGTNGGSFAWGVGFTAAGLPTFTWWDGAQKAATTPTAIPLNQWTHVAFIADAGTIKVYVNGVSQAVSGNTTLTNPNSHNILCIGNDRSRTLTGYLSNVRATTSVVYTGAFTPPAAPLTPIANTSLLLSGTNAGVADAAGKNVITTVGNSAITTTQQKYGTSSMYFDGVGDWIVLPHSPSLAFGSSDFTVECWINSPMNGGPSGIWAKKTVSGYGIQLQCQYTVPQLFVSMNGTTWGVGFSSTIAVVANTWTHLAVVRNGNVFTLYVNGVAGGSATVAGTVHDVNLPFVVGSAQNDGGYVFQGYMDDFRFTKGFARYTANFTPPTAALSVQ